MPCLGLALAAAAVAFPSAATARPASHGKALANSVTFQDSTGEDPLAPDITSVTVSNDDEGNITFQINVSNRPQLTQDLETDILLDTDQNSSTGDPNLLGADYIIELIPGQVGMFMWYRANFIPGGSNFIPAPLQQTLSYSYPATGPVIKINASDLGDPTGFNLVAVMASGITFDSEGNPDFSNVHLDFAPNPGQQGFWNYQITIVPPPPPPPPVTKLSATVGPGATISLKTAAGAPVRSLMAGSFVITVHDLSGKDDFHLSGPGVNRKTSVAGKGTVVWRVKLGAGAYRYLSDAHSALNGTFTVKPA